MERCSKFTIIIVIGYMVGFATLGLALLSVPLTMYLVVPLSAFLSLLLFWRYQQGKHLTQYSWVKGGNKFTILSVWLLFLIAFSIRVPSVLFYQQPLEKTAIFLLTYLLIVSEGWSPASFGFTLKNVKRQVLLGIVVLAIFLFGFLLSSWVGWLLLGWQLTFKAFTFVKVLPFMLTVGLGEEGLFRGYMQTKLRSFGRKKAIFTASFLLFGLWHVIWHVQPLHVIPLLFRVLTTGTFGVLFGIIYDRTGSLMGVIITHGVWDAVVESLRVKPGISPALFSVTVEILTLLVIPVILLFLIGDLAEKIAGNTLEERNLSNHYSQKEKM